MGLGFAGTVDVLVVVLGLSVDQVALFEKLLKVEGPAVVRQVAVASGC